MDFASSPVLRLLRTAHRLEARLSELLVPLELSLSQLRVLQLVAEAPGRRLTVNEIRERMLDPASNVSRLLNKLMDRGLIRKERETEDQRVVRIELTTAGRDAYGEGGKRLARGLAALELSEEEGEALRSLLERFPD